MRKIIDKKTYNTDTATKIAEIWHGNSYDDFNFIEEILYMTPNGRYFLYQSGGPYSKMGAPVGNNGMSGTSDITALDILQVSDILEGWYQNNEIDSMEYSDAKHTITGIPDGPIVGYIEA